MAGNGGEALEEQDFKVDLAHKVVGVSESCGGQRGGAGDASLQVFI